MKKVTLYPYQDKGVSRIAIRFDYDESLIKAIRRGYQEESGRQMIGSDTLNTVKLSFTT